MLPANLEREIEAAALIRNLQGRVRRLETLEDAGAGCLALIEDVVVSAEVISVSFTDIPQIYKHLWMLLNMRTKEGLPVAGSTHLRMTFNGSVVGYDYWRVSNGVFSHPAIFTYIEVGRSSEFGWVSSEANILDYTSTVDEKRVLWKAAEKGTFGEGATSRTAQHGGGVWNQSQAITRIDISTAAAAYRPDDTRFTLYGLC